VNLNRLSYQLRREVKAHPGKAALLGVLLAVALYYWIPLAGKWLGSSKNLASVRAQPIASAGLMQKPEKPSAVLPGGLPTVPTTPAHPSGNTSEAFPSWQQLVERRKADPRTRPVPRSTERRDPFNPPYGGELGMGKDGPEGSPTDTLAGNKKSSSASDSPGLQEPPESLELELTSIAVGPTRRVALINGRPYQEGNTFIFAKDGQQWEFHLLRILPTGILLQWNNRRYEVKLPRTPSNMEIQMVSSGQSESP